MPKVKNEVAESIADENLQIPSVEETAEGQKKVEPAVKPDKKSAGTVQQAAGRYIYVGPSLPAGLLKANSVFIGSKDRVLQNLESITERYPEVKRLIVPVSELTATKRELSSGGNAMSAAYKILSKSK